ncbi:MAG: HAD-IIA family hydrolase [Acidimicrobiia bacterium]|nr:MAG: HAD-IIA family hydrolase [Acidimicrobiia bacterium]
MFDLDGVVYVGSVPVDGAASAMLELRDRGWQLLFATNNSSKTPTSVTEVLRDRAGISVDPSAVITSGMAAAVYLRNNGLESAYVLGSPQLKDTVETYGVAVVESSTPDAVLVGLDRSLTYDKIDQAARAVRNGAAFVATNTDPTFPTSTGEVPGAGTIVAAVATASGSRFVTCGKPERPMIDLVSERIVTERVVMVGDRPETDTAFAIAAGWESVLTLTGVTATADDIPRHLVPNHVVASVAELPGILDGSSQ